MSKELTALEALCYLDDIAHGRKMDFNPHCLKKIVEKSLKALEIIKEKKVDIGYLTNCISYEMYEFLFTRKPKYLLTEEEFNLLKEVLK